jgi:predicted DNA-binding transcriptional regulator AlpA
MSATALTPADTSAKKYFDAKECAARYGMSWRHWLRLVDSGRAPQPTRFGRLVRWALASLEAWEAQGCPAIRNLKGGGR